MSSVHTKPWEELVREINEGLKPSLYLPMVRFIADSPWSVELFGGIFLSGLLISDSPDFQFRQHMLSVLPTPDGHLLFRYDGGSGRWQENQEREVSPEEAISILDLLLKQKFGVSLTTPKFSTRLHT